MKTIGQFNELRRYKQRQRIERQQEILGRALFAGMVLYIVIMALGGIK